MEKQQLDQISRKPIDEITKVSITITTETKANEFHTQHVENLSGVLAFGFGEKGIELLGSANTLHIREFLHALPHIIDRLTNSLPSQDECTNPTHNHGKK